MFGAPPPLSFAATLTLACSVCCCGGSAKHDPTRDALGVHGCNDYGPGRVPETLVTDQFGSFALAVDFGGVYFMSHPGMADADGSVRSIPLAGGQPTILADGLQGGPIELNPTNAYFRSGFGDLATVERSGAAVQTLSYGTAGNALAVDGANVYSVTASGVDGSGAVWKTPLGGGEAVMLAGGLDVLLDIALDEANVYALGYFGTLTRIPKAGGSVTTLVRGDYFAQSLTADAKDAYFAARQQDWTSIVVRVPLDGGQPSLFARGGGGGVAGIVVDAEHLYWFDQSEGEPLRSCLKKKPLTGGAPEVISSWSGYGFGLTGDTTHLYFSDGSSILRVAK